MKEKFVEVKTRLNISCCTNDFWWKLRVWHAWTMMDDTTLFTVAYP